MPLDAETKAFLDKMAAAAPPGWEELGPQRARQVFDTMIEFFGEGATLPAVEDRQTDEGVPLRIYHPQIESIRPAIVYLHGGGWVLGNLRTHDASCRNLAADSAATVIAVDYPLSPETKFPRTPAVCYAATQWVVDNAAELGIDAERIAITGDSAGGNLAASVCLMSRDRGGPLINYAVLVYPVIAPDFATNSYREFADGYGLTRAAMQWFWEQYLSSPADAQSPYAVPSAATDLSGLPPMLIVTAEYDVLRDEGEAFADQLREDGVEVRLKRYDGVIHGFMHMAGVFTRGRKAISHIAATLHEELM